MRYGAYMGSLANPEISTITQNEKSMAFRSSYSSGRYLVYPYGF